FLTPLLLKLLIFKKCPEVSCINHFFLFWEQYLELRFNKYVRLCGTFLFIVLTILYTGIVIYAPALALNQATGFDLWGAVVATGVVCTFYCTLGGLKAVIWTDVFQVGIMVAGFASVIIQAALIQGGISTILNDAYNGGRLNFWK
ncbi:Sodium-coupled monocarboxylate transporter 1, partial [Camelus dromedarius]